MDEVKVANNITLRWDGFKDFENLLDEINEDFGEKDAKNILRNGVRNAMKPVLQSARQNLIMHGNVDTGQLLASLQVEARKPNARDKRSIYSTPTMIMIARVTVASGKKFIPDQGGKSKLFAKTFVNQKTKERQHAHSDARSFAIEFGTARWEKGSGKPFIRPALESNAQLVTNSLAGSLRDALIKYKSKTLKA